MIFDLATQAALNLVADRVAKLELLPGPVPVPVPAPVVTAPLTVTDLAVVATTETSITLRFTEVSDGTGVPASYQLRYAPGIIDWGTASVMPLAGTTIGTVRDIVIVGRLPGTSYQFQIVAYRGTPNVNAVFGALSGVVTGRTKAPIPPPPPPPPVTTGLLFASDWASGTPKDNWDTIDEFNGGLPVYLLSVVAGFGPGGRNALKVLQRGSSFAANLRKKNIITPGQDFYVRYYFRTDDTSSAGDHIATCELYDYQSLTYLRKSGGPADWQHIISMFGCGYVYPIGHWYLKNRLANGAFYRLEYFVHWTSPTTIQVHPRVYDTLTPLGTLLYQDADYQQSDFGISGLWNGSQNWTLESYYAPQPLFPNGRDFCVLPQYVTEFGVGNNGQAGAADTGLPWYFAGVEIRTDRWPGP
jgi:hypothetical protein